MNEPAEEITARDKVHLRTGVVFDFQALLWRYEFYLVGS